MQATDQADALCIRLGQTPGIEPRIWVALQRSDVLTEAGRFDDAEHCLSEALDRCALLAPRQGRRLLALCHASMADLMEQQQRWHEAMAQWQQVIALDAVSIEPRLAQASLLADLLGRADEAATALQAALSLTMSDADRASTHRLLGQLLALALDQPEAARPHLAAAMATAPQPLDEVVMALATPAPDWPQVFDALVRALDTPGAMAPDNGLHRLLAHFRRQGQAHALAEWMRAHGAHQRQALLHGTLVAMEQGHEHLMTLNPETREAAQALLDSVPPWHNPTPG